MSEIIVANKGADIIISRPASYIVFGSGGLQGPPGAVGPRGEGIRFISSLPSTYDLPSTANLGDTYIISGKLWIYGSSGWEDAGPLQGPQGPQGETGATGERGPQGYLVGIRVTSTHIQWVLLDPDTGTPIGDWADLIALEDLKGDPGENGAEGPQGEPGENIELQLTETHIQWRAGEAGTWADLVALSAITGPAGADGRTILSGSGAPTTQGEDGDFYLDTAASTLYGPKNVTWPAGVSLIGPAGADGADGAGIPAIASGDASKVLAVKSDESGAEWVTAPSGGVSLAMVIALGGD